ncbi:MAG: hypothetical protein JO324_07330 [Candidatus Eremiobacteraeota bacterium]|nr:hypothetical protein [Candidatus Eremiobacteraeota bacterium]
MRHLVAPDRLKTAPLLEPLKNAIDFTPARDVLRLVDERLSEFLSPGTRLCVVSTTGITASRKNWGDGHEARQFASMLRARSQRWRVLSMDDETFGDADFRRVFASIDEPFARVFKALAARMDLFVGIPAGPLHFVLARGGIPAVGLWLAHHPDWYDEPNPDAIHLIGNYVRERGFDRRPATLTKPPSHAHRIRFVDTRTIDAEQVLAAADAVTT